MSEEEKKAIEFLKTFIKTEIDYCKLEKIDAMNILKLIEKQDNKIKFLLDDEKSLKEMNRNQMKIIEKQQKEIEEKTTILLAGAEKVKQLEKEIEEMREELQMYVDVQNNDIHNYISKDKIKEKIKEIENRRIEEGKCELAIYGFQRDAKIEVLQELLEEK